jgi:transposase
MLHPEPVEGSAGRKGERNLMDLKSFEYLIKNEQSVKRYLVKACWKHYVRFCIRCRAKKVYRIRRDRYRCGQCDYEFSDFTGRWLNRVKLPAKDWLWLIKLFELEISARKTSQQLGISYPTALKAFHLIRQSIAAHSRNGDFFLSGKIEAGQTYFNKSHPGGNPGETSQNRVPVFGILERKGRVTVEVLQDVSPEAVLNLTVKKVKTGSIVYTDKYRTFDALMFCGYKHIQVDRKRFSRDNVSINGLEGFWSFAKERIDKFHGVSKEKFPFYLKEMEFRYNHRQQPIFETLVQYICALRENMLNDEKQM